MISIGRAAIHPSDNTFNGKYFVGDKSCGGWG